MYDRPQTGISFAVTERIFAAEINCNGNGVDAFCRVRRDVKVREGLFLWIVGKLVAGNGFAVDIKLKVGIS